MSIFGLDQFRTPETDALAQQIFADANDDADYDLNADLNAIVRHGFYESIVGYDETFRMPRRLDIRLVGERLSAGSIALTAASDIFEALQRELLEATPAARASSVALQLDGISPGSTIMHLTPIQGEDEGEPGQLPARVDSLDEAVSTVSELHRSIEAHANVVTYPRPLIKAMAQLSTILSREDLEMEMTWSSGSGNLRTSKITRRGHAYVRDVVARETVTSAPRTLVGIIVSVDLVSNHFDLKLSTSKRAPRQRIHCPDRAALRTFGSKLGELVRVKVVEQVTSRLSGDHTLREFAELLPDDDRLL